MTWADELDAFARRLDEQSAALERGEPEAVTAFLPSPALGPLPQSLLPRAQELLARASTLTDALMARRNATGREIALLARIRPGGSSPSYVDQAL